MLPRVIPVRRLKNVMTGENVQPMSVVGNYMDGLGGDPLWQVV